VRRSRSALSRVHHSKASDHPSTARDPVLALDQI
jgi:hypothetical protein